MPVANNLSQRHQHILKATIEHYIATAEPVGSKTLAEEYNFNISSATIRNAFLSLEKVGLLYQPHTSAGRIPSDTGYRIYVDRLIAFDRQIGKQTEAVLQKKLSKENKDFESLLQRATKILARLSGYIALITFPQNSTNLIKHLQIVRVSNNQVMLIVVTQGYQTQSLLIDDPSLARDENNELDLIDEELKILNNFLNSKLQNRSLSELATINCHELDREFENYANFLRKIIKKLSHFSQSLTSTPVTIRGISTLLKHPEFSQMQQVQMLLHLLEEEQEQLLPLMLTLPELDKKIPRVTLKIGKENPLEPMQICTLISSHYYQDDIPIGSVGLIGPTRMLYENTIPMVEATADYLSEALK